MRSLAEVRQALTAQPVLNAAYAAVRDNAAFWQAHFADEPADLSGWGHNFFCDHCGEKLVFDPLHRTRDLVCAKCGAHNTAEKFYEAYVYYYRYHAVCALMDAALVYRVEGEQWALEYIRRVLSFYAERYADMPLHTIDIADRSNPDYQKRAAAGGGKLMAQGLDEAVALCRMLLALSLVKDSLDEAFLSDLNRRLFLPMSQVIFPQARALHNIPLWIVSACAMRALLFDDQRALHDACYSEFGVLNQLTKGATEENFWHEESLHYHYYSLTGPTFLCFLMKACGQIVPEVFDKCRRMYEAPLSLLMDDLRFVNPNDGWPDRYLYSYAQEYLLAAEIFDTPLLSQAALAILKSGQCEPSWANLLCEVKAAGDLPKPASFCWPDTNFAALRNDWFSVFIKFGAHVPGHAHPDLMNIEIDGFSYDLSNIGYGSPLTRSWYQRTPAHTTVALSGCDQPYCAAPDKAVIRHLVEENSPLLSLYRGKKPGKVLFFDESRLHVRCENVYEYTAFERSLMLNGNELSDEFIVDSPNPHVCDWFFHSEGELTAPDGTPADSGYSEGGYAHLSEVYRLPDGARLTWRTEKGALTLCCDPDAEAYVYRCPGNPAHRLISGVLLRKRGDRVCFNNRFIREP